ncbi:MAG: metallophosphoesterase [Bacteroidota bacterium]
MKIQICSDLHLEFPANREWLKEHPLVPKGDILVIAGDTYYLERSYHKMDFIRQVSKDFEAVYLIPGNHEYYGGFDAATALEPTFKEIMANVFLVNNHTVEIEDISFIFSTMWSEIRNHITEITRGMVDFHRIQFGEEQFNVDHFNHLHQVACDYLSSEVKKKGKKVVITHHLPSNACNAEEFKGSALNDAFCVEKTDFILDHEIDFWIYGHSHRNLPDFDLGGTKMITNQFGYVNWNEHLYFDRQKIVEVIQT